jgi:hypothetical protein
MKIAKVLILGTVFFAGCSPMYPPHDGYSSAMDSDRSDSAAATTSATADATGLGGDSLIVSDTASDIAPIVDLQIDGSGDLAVDSFEVPYADLQPLQNVCASNIPINLSVFVPMPGSYAARPDPPVLDGGVNPIDPFGGFGIAIDPSTGGLSVHYAADGWAIHTIPIIDGAFNYANGQGLDGRGGTNCPTDGFGICGSFVSPTEARGNYTVLFRCARGNSGNFIATLVQ